MSSERRDLGCVSHIRVILRRMSGYIVKYSIQLFLIQSWKETKTKVDLAALINLKLLKELRFSFRVRTGKAALLLPIFLGKLQPFINHISQSHFHTADHETHKQTEATIDFTVFF